MGRDIGGREELEEEKRIGRKEDGNEERKGRDQKKEEYSIRYNII